MSRLIKEINRFWRSSLSVWYRKKVRRTSSPQFSRHGVLWCQLLLFNGMRKIRISVGIESASSETGTERSPMRFSLVRYYCGSCGSSCVFRIGNYELFVLRHCYSLGTMNPKSKWLGAGMKKKWILKPTKTETNASRMLANWQRTTKRTTTWNHASTCPKSMVFCKPVLRDGNYFVFGGKNDWFRRSNFPLHDALSTAKLKELTRQTAYHLNMSNPLSPNTSASYYTTCWYMYR